MDRDKVVFPYESMNQAIKDKFKKIGGSEQALRFLAKGFKAAAWRKRADENARIVHAEQDAARARAEARSSMTTEGRHHDRV